LWTTSFSRSFLPLKKVGFATHLRREFALLSGSRANRKLAAKDSGSVLGNAHGIMHFPTPLILELWRYADLSSQILG
jgi:hypothetical protein